MKKFIMLFLVIAVSVSFIGCTKKIKEGNTSYEGFSENFNSILEDIEGYYPLVKDYPYEHQGEIPLLDEWQEADPIATGAVKGLSYVNEPYFALGIDLDEDNKIVAITWVLSDEEKGTGDFFFFYAIEDAILDSLFGEKVRKEIRESAAITDSEWELWREDCYIKETSHSYGYNSDYTFYIQLLEQVD